jgi:hypothetical protein
VTDDITGTSDAIGSGSSNTSLIVSQYPSGSYAANYCDELSYNGFDDWFLPSQEEMFDTVNADPSMDLSTSDWYWVSTQFSTTNARIITLPSSLASDTKTDPHLVRPMRRTSVFALKTLGYIYLGEKLEIPARTFGELPNLRSLDIESPTVGGGTLIKRTHSKKALEANVRNANDTEYQAARDYWNANGREPAIVIPYELDDQSAIKEMYTPFFCNPTFDFNGRTNYNVNNYKLTLTETK